MISSEDVRRVTFDKAMRGYRCDDVDDYLKQVAESMDALAAKNDEMQKNLVVLAQRIDQYRAEEDTLRTTIGAGRHDAHFPHQSSGIYRRRQGRGQPSAAARRPRGYV